MPKYKVVESVENNLREPVARWSDIEHHHPSDDLREKGRTYAYVNGQPEEVANDYRGTAVYTPGGRLMVSKDVILLSADSGSTKVPVPSPANGYLGEVDRRNGFVTLLDRPGGEVMFRLRHMAIGEDIRSGDHVAYGEPLGIQAGYGKGNPLAYKPHLHIDVNVTYLEQADRYLADMAAGAITTDQRPRSQTNLVNAVPEIEPLRGRFPPPPRQALADGKIELGERGPDVALLQEKLRAAGARDARGHEVGQDGHFGAATGEAIENYQRAHGLQATGTADSETLNRLGMASGASHGARSRRASDPDHPDHALLENVRAKVRELDQQAGKPWDDASERLAASALVMAKEKGFTARDDLQLAFNRPTERHAGGEVLHLMRQGAGMSPDPAANRTHMSTADALALPADERLRQLQAVSQNQDQLQLERVQHSVAQEAHTRSGLVLQM